MRVLKDPLVLFLLAGGVVFLLFWGAQRNVQSEVFVGTTTQDALIEDFRLLSGRDPTADERQQLIDQYVAEELLFRDALERNLHLIDPKTRASLLEKRRFQIAGPGEDPSQAELFAYYSDNLDRYRTEPAFTLTHRFFTNRPEGAEALLKQLRDGDDIEADSYWQGNHFPRYGQSALRSLFGPAAVLAMEENETATWFGPVESPRGWHFMRVEEAVAPQLLPFPQIKAQVERDFLRDGALERIEAYVETLKSDVDVVVE